MGSIPSGPNLSSAPNPPKSLATPSSPRRRSSGRSAPHPSALKTSATTVSPMPSPCSRSSPPADAVNPSGPSPSFTANSAKNLAASSSLRRRYSGCSAHPRFAFKPSDSTLSPAPSPRQRSSPPATDWSSSTDTSPRAPSSLPQRQNPTTPSAPVLDANVEHVEACQQSAKDGCAATERDVDLQMRMNKDLMMSSLWKLNVVDIEVTFLHVCEMVLHENNVKKEDLKDRANGLKNSRKSISEGKGGIARAIKTNHS